MKMGLHLPEIERPVRWGEVAELCRTAEAVGFDSIWMPDHLLYRFEGQPPVGPWECWSMLSAIAAVTRRVEIGPLVLSAAFRNPALIAKMAATLDEISGGRLILGLGVGWHEPEFSAYGFPFADRFARFAEAFTIIRTLLQEGEIDFQGRFFTLRECEVRPTGPRPGGPPLMIGSQGEGTLRHTLPHVAAWNGWHAWVGNQPERYPELRERVDALCREAGRDPATVERTLSVLLRLPGGEGYDVDPRSELIAGEPEQLAEALLRFRDEGLSHVQVVLQPNTVEAVARFGRVIEFVRNVERERAS
jgi:probable F420-dependent oxidoreductase